MKRPVWKLLCATALVAPWGFLAPAHAQEATTTDSAEIIVTAQKREQALQDIPLAVTAVTGATLEERGFTDATDLAFVVPNMQAFSGEGDIGLVIRGVGFTGVGAPGVAVHANGVYQPRPAMGDLAQTDVQRVEVLRGPQGTLYGRNANAGVVNYIATPPSPEFEGYIQGSYASYNEVGVQGVLNAPISDAVRTRFLVMASDRRDGFAENISGGPDGNNPQTIAGRFYLQADLASNLSFDLIASALHREGNFFFTSTVNPPLYDPAGDFWTGESNKTTIDSPGADTDRDAYAVTGIFNWDLGDWAVRSTTAYQYFSDDHLDSDLDGTGLAFYIADIFTESESLIQEVNLSGAIGPVDAVFGVFYMNEDYSRFVNIGFGADSGPLSGVLMRFYTPRYETTTLAAFTDLTWNVTDRLRVIGGFRYSEERHEADQLNDIPMVPFFCSSQGEELSFYSGTPRLGAQFDLSSDSNIYVNYSQGYKVGGFNTDTGCGDSYEPEQVDAYEIGWKNSFMNGALTFNASAFFYKYEDMQLQQSLGFSTFIGSAPESEVRGVELEMAWRPDDHWDIVGNISYLDAEFVEFFSVDMSGEGGFLLEDLNGNRISNTPEFSGNVGIVYTTDPIIAGGTLRFRLDASYRGDVYLREFNNPLDEQSAFTLLNGSVAWTSANDLYTVRVFGRNLTDEEYMTVMDYAEPTGARGIYWGDPRQVGIELRAAF